MKTTNEEPRRWFAEAMIPGTTEPTTFETFGEEAARAMCDISGWEFLRAWQEGGHSDRPARREPSRTITPRQLKALIVEARITYDIQQKVMDDDMPLFDVWRGQQLFFAAKVKSFKDIPSKLYNKVKNHFRTLRGAAAVGNPQAHRKQSGEQGDTMERRQNILFLMADELGQHAKRAETCEACKDKGPITPAYLVSIAAAKNKGHTIRDIDDLIKLPASRLEQLLYTIRNRIAAREGRGEAQNRNKGQGRSAE